MDNLLNWNLAIAENSECTELCVWLKMRRTNKPNLIDAELLAIKRVQEIRYLHIERNIEKSEDYYENMKFAMQSNIEQGLVVEKQHYTTIYLN